MVVCIKAVSLDVPLGQVVFFRSFFALIPLVIFLWLRREFPEGLKTKRPLGHLARSGFGALAMFASFASIARLPVTAMFWNWRGGYKFVKIEFSPTAPSGMSMTAEGHSEDATHGQGPRGWMLHLGSTQCAAPEATTPPSEACANPNRVAVALPDFVPGESTVVIDPAVVVAGADLTQNTPETSPGCMSFPNDPDCSTVLPRLGLAFNAFPAEEQVLVSMR
ncbi:MAG: metallo-mystery pair system four-Cys motif protein [Rhodobacteraceae bacterium]|nr:metallo-mystery pair system four-Cys motif protein [Paracoccaceae bacterium]